MLTQWRCAHKLINCHIRYVKGGSRARKRYTISAQRHNSTGPPDSSRPTSRTHTVWPFIEISQYTSVINLCRWKTLGALAIVTTEKLMTSKVCVKDNRLNQFKVFVVYCLCLRRFNCSSWVLVSFLGRQYVRTRWFKKLVKVVHCILTPMWVLD